MTELEGETQRIVRNWYVPLAFALVVLVSIALWHQPAPIGPLAWFGTFWAGVVLPFTLRKSAFRRRVRAYFRASRDALEVDDLVIPVAHIAEAKHFSRYGATELALVLREGKELSILLDDAMARALVDLLRIAPGERRTTFATTTSYRNRWLGAFAVLMLCSLGAFARPLLHGPPTDIPFFIGLFAVENALFASLVAVALGLVRKKLVIGADGFTVRLLLHRRYHAFADVAAVYGGVNQRTHVQLRTGKTITFSALEVHDAHGVGMGNPLAMPAHHRAAFARRTERGRGPAALRRGGRDARAWLDGLGALLREGVGAYRSVAITADELEAILGASDEDAEARIGAAVSLVRVDAEHHRTRVRLAADTCASPVVRDALLRIASASSDEELVAALATVSGAAA